MDDQELISKKELLEEAGISYGQLYRWKRKQLIPEEWFIRKSTFTGQETFFPRVLILPRIAKIQEMKEELPLDELAGKLSPYAADYALSGKELVLRGIVSERTLRRYGAPQRTAGTYRFDRILILYTVEKLLAAGGMLEEEGDLVLDTLGEHFTRFENGRCDLLLLRKSGVSVCQLVPAGILWCAERSVQLVLRQPMEVVAEELHRRLG
ncbi:DUF4004 family protein [Gorillibacterium sp. sgz5001074]|uniref:DUF4004 family protein n=1 Tax=Gorillibacterium sp. sgz5001074 TaxID=3446695 RepID=UPI003F66A3CF